MMLIPIKASVSAWAKEGFDISIIEGDMGFYDGMAALADDEAFCFMNKDNLALLRDMGAEQGL